MKLKRNFKRLLIFAVAAFMCLSAVNIVSAEFFDFESDDGGWTPTADWDPVGDWEWTDNYDESNYDWTDGTPPPAAYSGDGLWGTVLYSGHSNAGGESWLSQTFDFSSVAPADAVLSFYSWEDAFSTYDYCYVNVNGNQEYYSEDYAPTAWKYVEVDLSSYAGMSSVEIQFGLHASTVVNYSGWYIDDVNVAGSGGGGGGSGNDCSDPITVEVPGDIVFEDLGQTTCGKLDDYFDTGLDYYDGGEDIIYELDVTTDSTIIVDVSADTSWVGVGLFDDCPDVGTMVASDTYGPDLTFSYDVLAAESPYYLMVDTWPSPDCTEFDLTISEPQNDTGVSAINNPADGDGTDPVPVSVDVTNYGSGDEIDVPVHVVIEHEEGGGTMLTEGFEGTFPPADWTIATYGGTTYEWEQWAYSDTSYSYEPPGTGDYYAVAQDDETPSTDVDTGLFTPSIDMSGLTDVNVEFEQCFQDYAGSGEAEVRTYSGGVLEEVLLTQTSDGPYSGEHTILNFDPSTYGTPSDVQIEFWYTDDYYDLGAWGFAIDDVEVWAPSTMVTDYDETVNIDILAGETLTVDTFPDWTGMTGGLYDVQACTELAVDADTSNDCMEKLGVMIGLIDTTVTSINNPQALMGPVPFSPNATVENLGDFDMNSVPVHAWIEGGEELKFSETFESAAGFTYSDKEVAAESDFDTHTGEGVIKLVGEKQDMQAFSDWLVIDMDGDGTTWHQTDYNACEGTYSAYSGVEGVGYQSSSSDWLISPAIDVGTGGRIEADIDYDIETYWDHLKIGNSADGSLFYIQNYDGDSGGCTTISQDLNPAGISAGGTTYICFILESDSIFNYEGAFVDNVKVYGGGVVYDETVNVDIPVGSPVDVEFPEFNPPDAADYTINVCTEHPVDENTANDCQDLAFTTNAPVYIEETGIGFGAIQPAIDAAENGQTVVATDGTYTEDLVIDKPITVTGELGDESVFDNSICSWDLDHETFLRGTVDITGSEMVDQPEPTDCDYEILLYDDFGDGWNGGSLDVLVDGTIVLDDITLTSGSGPASFTFTVSPGSTIDVLYTPGSWAYENYFTIKDSEGNIVVANYYPDDSGDWTGTASCPAPPGVIMDTIFENFDVNPPTTFTTHDTAVQVGGSNVIVRQNTIHNVRGLVEDSMFTIKGIHIYNGDSSANSTGIVIQNNTIRDILNENMTASGGTAGTILSEDFEGTCPPAGWTINDAGGDGVTWFCDDDTDPYGLDLGGATGTYMHVDDDYDDTNIVTGEELITPVLDCSNWEDVTVDFHGDFEAFAGDGDFYLDVYDGSSWVNVWYLDDDYDPAGSGTGFDESPMLPMDVSDYADGNANFQVRFYYTDEDDSTYGMLIDNVVIEGVDTSGGPTYTYGGATGVMVQGFLDEVTVENNRIEDIHSAGWCYGVEYTPTNIASFADTGRQEWLGYDDGSTENALGLTSGGTITMAIELDADLLSSYYGEQLTKFKASIGDDVYGPVGHSLSYEVWIEDSLPSNPTSATVYYSGSSDPSKVWHEEPLDMPYDLPDSGSVYVGVTFYSTLAGDYPCGMDDSNSDPRGDNLWYDGGSWMHLTDVGYPNVWGLDVFAEAGGGPSGGKEIVINCNYFTAIGDGTVYDVFNDTSNAPYPGVMFTVDEAPIPGPADASVVTLKCNYFDPGCTKAHAVINKDMDHPLDATMNYWGSPNGPGGDVMDAVTGTIADGFGANIVEFGPVMFDAWLGVHADIANPAGKSITVEAGTPINFKSDGSFAYCFNGCEECCNPEAQDLQFLWDFDDDFYSSNPDPTHIYDQPGIYDVTLQVDSFGFPYHGNFMYDWEYITVEVIEASQPLNANADGENLGTYEATLEQPITLYGEASGGQPPYYYSWEFGDGTSTQVASTTPTVTHSYLEEGTYTVTLTIMDQTGEIATDTSTVIVHGIEELIVNIDGSSHIAEGDAAEFTSTVSGGRSPYSYQWNFGDGVISTEANPTHVYESSGTYTVTLTVTDAKDNQKTKTQTITVGQTDTSEVEITNVNAGLLLSATIDSDEQVSWTIDVQGTVLFGGHAEGTAEGSTQIRLPFSIGFGKVDITVTAGSAQEQFTATMIGPFLLNLQEA